MVAVYVTSSPTATFVFGEYGRLVAPIVFAKSGSALVTVVVIGWGAER